MTLFGSRIREQPLSSISGLRILNVDMLSLTFCFKFCDPLIEEK